MSIKEETIDSMIGGLPLPKKTLQTLREDVINAQVTKKSLRRSLNV